MEASRRQLSSRRREVTVNQPAPSLRVDRNSPVPLYFQVAQHLEQLIESGELPTGARLENELDRSSPVPLYHQLAEQLTAAITDGRLRPGDPFENEIGMSGRLNLSRPTVRRAISELVNQGLLVRRRGIGTTVANQMVHRKAELTSLYDDLAKAGRGPDTHVLSFERQPLADGMAPDLGLPAGAEVYVFERLRYADGEPLALLRNWVPAGLLALTADDLEAHGLYNLLRGSGVTLRIARQSIGARAATTAEARALGETRGAPLLTMDRAAYDDQGRAIEHGRHLYRASRYSFDLTLTGW
jgi:GntR family transcriptional regulator